VNQTLSRTILTALTVFIVVVILYIWGGEGIHGFAFSLVVGVIAGSYSSIYMAAPVLLWLINRDYNKTAAAANERRTAVTT
jgi:SecD/SecF fusion protein